MAKSRGEKILFLCLVVGLVALGIYCWSRSSNSGYHQSDSYHKSDSYRNSDSYGKSDYEMVPSDQGPDYDMIDGGREQEMYDPVLDHRYSPGYGIPVEARESTLDYRHSTH